MEIHLVSRDNMSKIRKSTFLVAQEMAMNNFEPFHLAALLYRNNKLVRIGINGARHRPEFMRFYSNKRNKAYSCHAEMDAILMAKPGDRLEVMRWLANGSLANARPCVHCRRRIKRLGLIVNFTNKNGEWERL